jgi:hypothetical protein
MMPLLRTGRGAPAAWTAASLAATLLGLAVCGCGNTAGHEPDGRLIDPPFPELDALEQADGVETGDVPDEAWCGNGLCDTGESCETCPDDCGACPVSCPNGTCDAGEDCSNCPEDCGACLPTCGEAGGNTCTDASTTLCRDLPLIASSDCAVCCSRRPLPAVGPNGFHIIVRADTDRWDGIVGLMDRGAILCSENRPDSIPPDRWCRKISGDYDSADQIVDKIHLAFQVDPEQPAKIMIDELERSSIDKITQVAALMRLHYSQYTGLWGVFIENTDVGDPDRYYGPKEGAINELLLAGAILAAEMYIGKGYYCSQGSNYGERDVWLADWFRGDFGTWKKFAWLAEQRSNLGSSSHLSVVFGVTDSMVGTSDAYIFIDRLFYVWVTRSGFPSTLDWTNGGAGAYKWEAAAVSSANRDNLFADSYNHYCFGNTSSRFTNPTFCP